MWSTLLLQRLVELRKHIYTIGWWFLADCLFVGRRHGGGHVVWWFLLLRLFLLLLKTAFHLVSTYLGQLNYLLNFVEFLIFTDDNLLTFLSSKGIHLVDSFCVYR